MRTKIDLLTASKAVPKPTVDASVTFAELARA